MEDPNSPQRMMGDSDVVHPIELIVLKADGEAEGGVHELTELIKIEERKRAAEAKVAE